MIDLIGFGLVWLKPDFIYEILFSLSLFFSSTTGHQKKKKKKESPNKM